MNRTAGEAAPCRREAIRAVFFAPGSFVEGRSIERPREPRLRGQSRVNRLI
jgi:hypothetical protein